MTTFQTGGVKNKGVVDNLFVLRGLIDHSKYLKKELWITFYDIEKCFDSLWLEDCINSLWRCGVDDDILYLIYLLNRKANTIVRTPFGNTQSLEIRNLVKQGTVLGPILNNCSLDDIYSEGHGHNMGTVEIKTLEFVDDIADPNNGYFEALKSNQTILFIQKRKRLTFSAEKYKILKINSTNNSSSLFLSGIKLEVDPQFRYLGDIFNNKGSNSSLCEDRVQKAKGSSNEIISLCKESILGNTQISNMILLYHIVFIPRLIYNCESWSNLNSENYAMLQKSQLTFLRRVMELPRSVPTDALFLEMGIWPIRFEIEFRQLTYLKRIIDRDQNDPVYQLYQEMLKYSSEKHWANNILDLRRKYNLPLKDENISNRSKPVWKSIVKRQIQYYVFNCLLESCQSNRKTALLRYNKFKSVDYLTKLDSEIARVLIKARLRMFEVKVNFKKKCNYKLNCPFCTDETETFDHIFQCPDGVLCPQSITCMTLEKLSKEENNDILNTTGRFLLKYAKYREFLMK